jgi:putative CocE/NonD family hydrolase
VGGKVALGKEEGESKEVTSLWDAYQPSPMPLKINPSSDLTFRSALNVPVPLRNNTVLMTDFYFPLEKGKYPVVLERTPFNRRTPLYAEQRGPLFARSGFVYIVQNVRGLFGSQGYFFPYENEGSDGLDMHKWIAVQPWFSGTLGSMGSGYGAYAACMAAPDSPVLKAMIIENSSSDLFLNGGYYMSGVPMTGCLYSEIAWRLMEFPALMASLRWDDALFHLPLREMDDVLGHTLPFWDECLLHPSYDYFWQDLSLEERLPRIDSAVLHVGGWYNQNDLGGVISIYEAMVKGDKDRGRSGRQSLMVGPWSSGVNSESSLGYYDFTPASKIDEDALYLGWFSKWLMEDPQVEGLPASPVRIFALGSNDWLELPVWPPSNTELTPYFLHSNGQAGMGWNEGTLTEDPPLGFEEIDTFISDPSNPVLSELELGTDDQRPVERRRDVLTYTSPPLEEDLMLVGSAQVVLYVNALGPDADLFIMLTDVDEYGFSRPVSLGVRRLRFRDSFRTPSPVSPADIHEYFIDLTPIANRFLKGHSIRLNIMGSYFPFLTRNLNTGAAIGQSHEIQQAAIFLLHDFDYPSRIVLPILP